LPPSVLEYPHGFDLYQRLVGAPASKRRFVDGFVRARSGDRVLDLGCGTGALLGYLPDDVEYVGVDVDAGYVEAAQKRYGERATFVVADATTYRPNAAFDIAIAYGVVHHLEDAQVAGLLRVARSASRFVAAEPCRTPDAGTLEAFLMQHDRGKHIRSEDEYVRIAREVFDRVDSRLVAGTYRIPFTLAILDCS
jgi:SAM-dependent methyltransferase